MITGCLTHANRCQPLSFHYCPEVSVVDVDQTGTGDCLGDALDELADKLVRNAQGVLQRQVACYLRKLGVVDCDDGVAVLAQPLEPLLRVIVSVALYGERQSHDADYESASVPKFSREIRCGSRTGTPAEASADENDI